MKVRYRPRPATRRIILHDSHTPPYVEYPAEALRCTARHMGLLEAGYHYAIGRSGAVYSLRQSDTVGSHTPGHNEDSIGICLIGGRDDEGRPADTFTPEQMRGLYLILSRLNRDYGGLRVVGHSEVQRYRNRKQPPCPFLDMQTLRREAQEWSEANYGEE